MNHFRITKYNPLARDSSGAYIKPDWTGVSDIGSSFGGTVLTEASYLATEDAYVSVALGASKLQGINAWEVDALELGDEKNFSSPRLGGLDVNLIRAIVQSKCFDCESGFRALVKANLREMVWCKILGCGGLLFYIHFGYDYYMYIGCEVSADNISRLAANHSLFAEECLSPYLEGEP